MNRTPEQPDCASIPMTIPIRTLCVAALAWLAACAPEPPTSDGTGAGAAPTRIGVVYVVHGGFAERTPESLWSATLQIFAYDPHSRVYQGVIWNPAMWPRILSFGNAPKELGKYDFEYRRIGGVDPSNGHYANRLAQLRAELDGRAAALGVEFVVDQASWIAPDPRQHAWPRMLYEPGVAGGSPLTYCGSETDGGPWPGCDPQRFDTDGTIERLLAAGVDEIVMIDMTTSGVRFFKTFDVVRTAREVVARYNAANGTDIAVYWANDPQDLMRDSYPDRPENWTLSLGPPAHDRDVPLAGHPNPVAFDPRLAAFHVDGIAAELRPDVPAAKTGVLLVNHATRVHNQLFDPKIDDTLVLNANIERELRARYPDLPAEQVVGAWMGVKERRDGIYERTREMRGENLGHAYLYQSDERLPEGKWGYRYWDALAALKDRGVEHIVVAFPQIMVDSVLNLVELPNQIGRELGYRTWRYDGAPDFARWPETGHPFADYWGIWVETQCRYPDAPDVERPCCFELGGCADGRAYPPPRQVPADRPRDDLDPSLAWDVPAYGHLGYDPARGAPRDDRPVQAQYRGTWSVWQPPNSRPDVAAFLADHVVANLDRRR